MNAKPASAPKPIDVANVLQHRATNPDRPVWVGASAGSGKTTVLVNRLLRLMLPASGRPAAEPAKILGITFTKAAASEVMERIIRNLRDWAIIPEEKLIDQLEKLMGEAPDRAQIEHARSLFARVLEAPGGMKVMTIHAFCQSILARFPMEARLPAGFEVMEEREADALMTDVRRNQIMRLQLRRPEDESLQTAFDFLSTQRNAEQIENLIRHMTSERARLRALLIRHQGIEGLCASVDKALRVPQGATKDDLIRVFLEGIPDADLRPLLPVIEQGLSDDRIWHPKLACMLAADVMSRWPLWDDYRSVFLTDGCTIRKFNKSVLKNHDALAKIYSREAERILALDMTLRNLATAQSTKALLRFAAAALDEYEREKRARNRLDFEDLIDRVRLLLSEGGVHWVHYKLDKGIDHILVDEAQDTNPDQWDIITALYDEFYDGTSAREPLKRTTFVVGDEKQSIFSFQRADPRIFAAQHARLAKRAADAEMPLETIPMAISFRSSPSILRMVDATFAPAAMRAAIVQNPEQPILHEARWSGMAGRVEIWPNVKKEKSQMRLPWDLPIKPIEADNPVVTLAERVAQTIKRLIDDPNEKLASQNRRIEAGDVMILVAKRKPMADAILKALRRHDIPVAGIDRMIVTQQIAVQDVLAVIAFVLQPDDDLNLAALLKSPFIALDEDALFKLSYDRQPKTLWQALKDSDHGAAAIWLSELLETAGTGSVSAFLHRVLYGSCPTDSHSGMRALLGRLGRDARDPLQELLARADRFDVKDVRGLQGFLQDARNDDSELKRQMEDAGGRVRLMTVHGSKGLEAPIVFMPDTLRAHASRAIRDAVLWPERDDVNGVPYWSSSEETRADAYQARLDEAKRRGDAEYKRLLYVALTRAADRLYIAGAQKSEDRYIDKDSWYFACANAFDSMSEVHVENDVRWIENSQTDKIRERKKKPHVDAANVNLPPWVYDPAPEPMRPPRPLTPSKPEIEDPSAMSPLLGDDTHRFKRGRIMHTLFQFLPDLPVEARRSRARLWLAQPLHGLSGEEQTEMLNATMRVLDDPIFATLFTNDARAEVPLTGLLGKDRIVSAQIDRLLVTGETVTVVDYKTNRPAPKNLHGVPEAYIKQMRTYRDLLKSIWPGRSIRCALLWTDGPHLMDISALL